MRTLQQEFMTHQKANYSSDVRDRNYPTSVKLKCGFLCPNCQQSVLAYRQPKTCADHD